MPRPIGRAGRLVLAIDELRSFGVSIGISLPTDLATASTEGTSFQASQSDFQDRHRAFGPHGNISRLGTIFLAGSGRPPF
jgi:hypothetical protein